MSEQDRRLFAGIDWATKTHAICVVDEHGEIHQSRVSVDCPDEEKASTLDALSEAIPEAVAGTRVEDVNTADGFKLLLEDGSWLLVRPSGTEPKLRVYAEAEDEGRVEALLEAGSELVREAR